MALCATLSTPACGGAAKPNSQTADVDAARKTFQANLDAIRRHDLDAYLATYLNSETLARTGPGGTRLGFADHASQSRTNPWPDVFVGRDMRLVPVSPGVVYGTYRYRVCYGTDEHAGVSERVFVSTPQGWRIAATSAFDAPPGTPPPPLALVGATLVDGTGSAPVPDAVVVVRGGRIECAGRRDRCPVPEGVEVVDVSGRWITPGIVDAHVHFSQTGWADGRPDALDLRDRHPYAAVENDLRSHPERFFRADLGSGVTAVFDVGGYPWTWGLRDTLRTDAPHVAAAGPLLSTLDHWLNLPAERQFIYIPNADTARDGVRFLATNRTDAVKVWFIVRAGDDFGKLSSALLAAGDEARKQRLPLIVHATNLREAKVALQAGVRVLVHSVQDTLVDAEFLDLARRNGTIYCPTLIVEDGYVKLFEAAAAHRAPAIDDPHASVDSVTIARVAETASVDSTKLDRKAIATRAERAEKRARVRAENLVRVHAAGIPIAMGTDAGNPMTLHGPGVYAEMEAMQAAGMSAVDVLVASTRGGALAMGQAAKFGTLEPGKSADLLVLDADPTTDIAHMRRLLQVMRGGELRAVEEFRRR